MFVVLPRPRLLVSFVACSVLVLSQGASAQIHSIWQHNTDSGDWFDAARWTNGVPQDAGDQADVFATGSGVGSPIVTAPLSLGQLRFGGDQLVRVIGDSVITFDQPGDDPAVLTTHPVFVADGTVSNPLAISAGETLLVHVAGGAVLNLDGAIVSADGDLFKTGLGRFVLRGDNSAWQGMLSVSQGDVKIEHVNALGNTAGVTRIAGGRVLIGDSQPPTRGTAPFDLGGPLSESFILEGGVLETTQRFLSLEGNLELPAGSTGVVRGPFNIRGGTTGAGDLHILASGSAATRVSDTPLAHTGGVHIASGETSRQSAQLTVDNTYTGPTTISNMQLNVHTPGGLGDAATGTTISGGSDLRLHGGSSEDVMAVDSTLSLWSAETTLPELRPAGQISLHNALLTTYGDFRGAANYIVDHPIALSGDSNRIGTERGALTIAGGVIGSGDLVLEPDNFPIHLSSAIDHSGSLELQGDRVHFLHGAQYDGDVLFHGGDMVVETDLQLSRISTVRPQFNSCCPSGHIEVVPGASLQVERIELRRGLLQGRIYAAEGVHLADPFVGPTIQHVDTNLQYHVLSGQATLNDSRESLPATNGDFRIGQKEFAAVLIAAESVTDASFHLNNGSGFNFGGALVLGHNPSAGTTKTVIRGRIDLGGEGAHIGGQATEVRVEGQISGGDLNLGRRRGRPNLQLVGGTAAYTGATRIFSGEMVLAESGRLTNTSQIELYSEGALYLDNSLVDGPQPDRIADDVPIRLYGGAISAWPTQSGVVAVERIGAVHAAGGLSSLAGYRFRLRGDQFAEAKLQVGSLSRDPGAVVMINPSRHRNFDIGDVGGSLLLNLESPPPVTNGILPPWLLFAKTQFATMGPDGVRAFLGPTVDIAASNETSIVRPSTNGLDRDRTVHAWNSFGNAPSVDLNGYTLTVGSGGLLGAKLSNGRVMPGQHANGELIISTDFELDVDIADNGGPTSVTFVGDGEIRGTSTYTGTTYLVGQPGDRVRVIDASALPVGGDVEISGYTTLQLDDPEPGVRYRLGNVTLRDGGSLFKRFAVAPLMMESLELEAGVVENLALSGDFPVSKRTEGYAELHTISPEYSGRIDVFEGTLQLGFGPGHLAFHASSRAEVVVHQGARLALAPASEPATGPAPTPTVTLAGGDLLSAVSGFNFKTNFIGDIHVTGDSTAYGLDAREDQPVARRLQIDGAYRVAPGASLTIVGFDVIATEGVILAQDAALGGTGILNADVEVAGGAVLSPGLIGEKLAVGTLSTDCCQTVMSWGESGRYRWEMNDAEGVAGAPVGRGWDMLLVGGELAIDSTSDDPFIIEPIALGADGEMGAAAGLLPNTQYRWLIAEIGTLNAFTATIRGFAPEKFAFDVAKFQQIYPQVTAKNFSLDLDARGLHLNFFVVPEPTPISLILCACAVVRHCFRRLRARG